MRIELKMLWPRSWYRILRIEILTYFIAQFIHTAYHESCNYLRRLFHVLCRISAKKVNFIEHPLCIVLWGRKSCLNLKSYLLIFPKGLFCLISNISPIKTKYVGVFWVNTMKISKCNRRKTWYCRQRRKCDLEEKVAGWQHVRRCTRQYWLSS